MEQLQAMAQLEAEVNTLSERRRRAYYRYVDKLKGKKKKKVKKETTDDTGSETVENKEENAESTPLSLDEFMRNAQHKLDELKKGMADGDDLFDELENLSIGSDDDSDDDRDDDIEDFV